MIKLLVYIKHNAKFLWRAIEFLNGIFFGLLFRKKIYDALELRLQSLSQEKYQWRFIDPDDLSLLEDFFKNEPADQFRYFNPHGFSFADLRRAHHNPSLLMLGVFDGKTLVGYFFLRCFLNKKCFTGRIVSHKRQGEGLSKIMGRLLIDSAWDAQFRVFGTASKSNFKSLGSYRSINKMNIVKELNDGYILFEYVKSD